MSTSEKLDTVNKKWNRLYGAYIHLHTFIKAVRSNVTGMLELDSTNSYLEDVGRQAITGLNPYLNEAFSDIIADKQGLDRIVDEAAKRFIFKIQNYIDATSIIFMHSILEASLVDLLQITLGLSRSKWLKYIAEKTVTYGTLNDEKLEQLQNRSLQKCFNKLKRRSIMTKCKHIFEICQETDISSIMPRYEYNKEKLKEIDDLRHDIVHGLKIEGTIDDMNEKIEYLTKTGFYFFHVIHRTYDLTIDMDSIEKSL